jgi:hypothetical protein
MSSNVRLVLQRRFCTSQSVFPDLLVETFCMTPQRFGKYLKAGLEDLSTIGRQGSEELKSKVLTSTSTFDHDKGYVQVQDGLRQFVMENGLTYYDF